ncbi:MAG: TolC family protein [Chitinophagales bacterium]|nr:TolC family protein [Chitinophagales bacterium]
MRKIKLIAISLLLYCINANAQVSYTLDEAVQYALQNSTQIRSAQLNSAETRNLAYKAITEGLPKVNGKLEYTNNWQIGSNVIVFKDPITGESSSSIIEFGTPHQTDLFFDASQLLVDGRYFVGLKARKSIIKSSELQFEMERIALVESVKSAYFAALAADEAVELLMTNLESLNAVLRETTLLYENGFAEELDVDRLKLNKANLISRIQTAENQEKNSLNALKFQIGVPLTQEITLSESLNFFTEQLQFDELLLPDPMFRVEYRLLQNRKLLRQYDITQKKAGYYPTLYAFAKLGTSAFREEFDFTSQDEKWFSNGAAGLTLNIPIFDGLSRNSSIQESRIKLEMSKNEIAQFEQSLELEVSSAYSDYLTAFDNYRNLTENVGLAQKIFDKTTIMYREGVGSSLDLANAESELTSTQINYINSIYELMITKTRLDKSLGKL